MFGKNPEELPTEATPFDVRGVELFHHGDDDCRFETMLRYCDLADRVLWDLARLVHEEDLADEAFGAPYVRGPDVICWGYPCASR